MCDQRVIAADAQIAWLRRVIEHQRSVIWEERAARIRWQQLAPARGRELYRGERQRLAEALPKKSLVDMTFWATADSAQKVAGTSP